MILGRDSELSKPLGPEDVELDTCLEQLYDDDRERGGGLGASSPRVARWLGDIRRFFPKDVVKVLQKDAFERLGLQRMLLEPELLEAVEADVHLVASLLSLNQLIPERTRDTARQVVRQVVADLMRELREPTREAIEGTLSRAVRNPRPRLREIDWARTILKNLQHYQPEYRTVIPERLVGFGRRRASLRDIILVVDQSGSMAPSVVYSSIFSAVLASLPAVSTQLVLFDTAVVDLTDKLRGDPVDVLFATQLGGGTDIDQALGYAQTLVERPDETILVLLSDMYEGGDRDQMLERAARLVYSGVNMIGLLALSDEGRPSYDTTNARELTKRGVPCFACTPKLFPSLMAAAIQRRDLAAWAALHGIDATSRENEEEDR